MNKVVYLDKVLHDREFERRKRKQQIVKDLDEWSERIEREWIQEDMRKYPLEYS